MSVRGTTASTTTGDCAGLQHGRCLTTAMYTFCISTQTISECEKYVDDNCKAAESKILLFLRCKTSQLSQLTSKNSYIEYTLPFIFSQYPVIKIPLRCRQVHNISIW